MQFILLVVELQGRDSYRSRLDCRADTLRFVYKSILNFGLVHLVGVMTKGSSLLRLHLAPVLAFNIATQSLYDPFVSLEGHGFQPCGRGRDLLAPCSKSKKGMI